MNELRSTSFLLLVMLLVVMSSCNQKKSNDKTSSDAEGIGDGTPTRLEAGSTYYYGLKTAAANSDGSMHNFEFLRFSVEENGQVSGVMITAPYGTDGMRGSFKGVYHEDDDKISAQLNYLAEGERYNETRDFPIRDGGIDLGYTDAQGKAVVIPAHDKAQYEAMLKEYRLQWLPNVVNTSDRSRLTNVAQLKEYLSAADLLEAKFMERAIDLDHDPSSMEYLLYVMSPMLCGSGGCNLFVINDKGEVLSEMTVVKMPVYTSLSSIGEEMAAKGQLRELFVWSQGMRQLKPKDGAYPSNPSVEPQIMEEQLLNYPEQYRLVMDYLE